MVIPVDSYSDSPVAGGVPVLFGHLDGRLQAVELECYDLINGVVQHGFLLTRGKLDHEHFHGGCQGPAR